MSTSSHEIYDPKGLDLIEAAKRSAGLSLAGVFRKHVLDDPEVTECGKRVRDQGMVAPMLRDGQFPGLSIDFKWPLDITSKELAFQILKLRHSLFEIPEPPDELKCLAMMIADRVRGLRTLLINGEVSTEGTFAKTGLLQPLDQLQWARQPIWLDVCNSDLLAEEERKPTVIWTGIRLVSRDATDMALSKVMRPCRSRRKRPKADPVEAAMRKAGIDFTNIQLEPAEIVSKIVRYLERPPRTENDEQALRKMVWRILKDSKQLPRS